LIILVLVFTPSGPTAMKGQGKGRDDGRCAQVETTGKGVLAPSGSHRRSKVVGDTGIEPVTSTVSRCRFCTFGSALSVLTWAAAEPGPTDFPVFPLVAPRVLGPL
jgi:hypothetical protein